MHFVKSVKYLADYKLLLSFEDGTYDKLIWRRISTEECSSP